MTFILNILGDIILFLVFLLAACFGLIFLMAISFLALVGLAVTSPLLTTLFVGYAAATRLKDQQDD
jgi:hypothetical protein